MTAPRLAIGEVAPGATRRAADPGPNRRASCVRRMPQPQPIQGGGPRAPHINPRQQGGGP
jgi:hypothetical protein